MGCSPPPGPRHPLGRPTEHSASVSALWQRTHSLPEGVGRYTEMIFTASAPVRSHRDTEQPFGYCCFSNGHKREKCAHLFWSVAAFLGTSPSAAGSLGICGRQPQPRSQWRCGQPQPAWEHGSLCCSWRTWAAGHVLACAFSQQCCQPAGSRTPAPD